MLQTRSMFSIPPPKASGHHPRKVHSNVQKQPCDVLSLNVSNQILFVLHPDLYPSIPHQPLFLSPSMFPSSIHITLTCILHHCKPSPSSHRRVVVPQVTSHKSQVPKPCFTFRSITNHLSFSPRTRKKRHVVIVTIPIWTSHRLNKTYALFVLPRSPLCITLSYHLSASIDDIPTQISSHRTCIHTNVDDTIQLLSDDSHLQSAKQAFCVKYTNVEIGDTQSIAISIEQQEA